MTDKEIILELLKTLGDLIVACQARQDLVFDNTFPWYLTHNSELFREARSKLDPHEIWDLTYNEETRDSLKRALGKYEI